MIINKQSYKDIYGILQYLCSTGKVKLKVNKNNFDFIEFNETTDSLLEKDYLVIKSNKVNIILFFNEILSIDIDMEDESILIECTNNLDFIFDDKSAIFQDLISNHNIKDEDGEL